MDSTNGFYFPFEQDVNKFFQENHTAMALLSILVIGYVSRYAPALPRAVDKVMNNLLAQFVFFFLLGYLTSSRLVSSALVAAGVILVIYLLNRYAQPKQAKEEHEEATGLAAMLPYNPADELKNLQDVMITGLPKQLPNGAMPVQEQPEQPTMPSMPAMGSMPMPMGGDDNMAPAGYEGFGQYAYLQ